MEDKTRLGLECIDRAYLNLYVPMLHTPQGLVGSLRKQPGVKVYSTTSIAPMTRALMDSIERYSRRHDLELSTFGKGQRKEQVALEYGVGASIRIAPQLPQPDDLSS